jgi:hypothetical protein
MNTPVQNLFGLLAGIWPRIAGFSDAPSLLAIALIANLVAIIPTAFRMQKESLSYRSRMPGGAESAPANVPSD